MCGAQLDRKEVCGCGDVPGQSKSATVPLNASSCIRSRGLSLPLAAVLFLRAVLWVGGCRL